MAACKPRYPPLSEGMHKWSRDICGKNMYQCEIFCITVSNVITMAICCGRSPIISPSYLVATKQEELITITWIAMLASYSSSDNGRSPATALFDKQSRDGILVYSTKLVCCALRHCLWYTVIAILLILSQIVERLCTWHVYELLSPCAAV